MTAPVSIDTELTSCALCGSSGAQTAARGLDYEYWTSLQEFRLVQCEKCGHYYLNPRPGSHEAEKIYPKNYFTLADPHLKKTSGLIIFMKSRVIGRRLAFFKDRLPGPFSILEIGCGDCALLLDLKRKYPHLKCTGVDIAVSPERKEQCKAFGITLIEGQIEDIQVGENQFDLIIMNQVIEHLWAPRAALKKLHRSLALGGMISIETVNMDGYDRRFFSRGSWGGYYFPRHLNLFTFQSLKLFIEDNGFSVVQQYSLLAPIIWTYSFHALLCPGPERSDSWVGRFFSDRNPVCLALFTLVDLVASSFGVTTSNQKVIARKV